MAGTGASAIRLSGREARRRLGVVLAVAIAVWLAAVFVGGDSGALAMFRAHDRRQELEERVRALEKENDRLRGEIERLKDDPETIERIAREELMMARPGEEVILVREGPATSRREAASSPATDGPR